MSIGLMKKYLQIFPKLMLALGLLGPLSCQKDEWRNTLSDWGIIDKFHILSVESSGTGEEIELSLNLKLQDDETLRARTYTESALGELSVGTDLQTEEQVHLILRRKGSPKATTYVTVTCKGRQGNKLELQGLKIKLPEGVKLSKSDVWYVTGTLGGDGFDMSSGRISMGKAEEREQLLFATRANRTVEVPYSFPWMPISVVGDNNMLSIPSSQEVELKPLGALLRLHFYSNMVEDYRALSVKITSNALRSVGYFDAMSYDDDELLNKYPRWKSEQKGDSDASPRLSWSYKLARHERDAEAQNLLLPGLDAWVPQRTVFVWGMPTEVLEEQTHTRVELEVQSATQPASGATSLVETYSKAGHRPLRSGSSYRLSNVLTSDVLISEVFYQYASESRVDQNYSIVELYNPTGTEIDLSDYALARVITDTDKKNKYFYSTFKAPRTSVDHETIVIPLSMMLTSNKHPAYQHQSTLGEWRKVIYGTPSIKLKPGQTLLIGAGSYVVTEHKPSKNIELYNELLTKSPERASNQMDVFQTQKLFYPHAGMQIDSAVLKGYAQSMVAFNNAAAKNADPSPRNGAATLQLGGGQGVALVKATRDASAGGSGYRYNVVDANVPVSTIVEELAYQMWLQEKLNERGIVGGIQIKGITPYSLVRSKGSNFPSPTVNTAHWSLEVTENNGVKSLGTRDYVAGLTPYANNYTGYAASNNPQGRPFWREVSNFVTPPSRAWSTLPATGENNASSTALDVPASSQKIKIISGTATSYYGADPIEKAFDGDYGTNYHSSWSNSGANYFPITLTFDLEEASNISYMMYYPRQSGYNGYFKLVDIQYSTDGTSFKDYIKKDFKGVSTPTRVDFSSIKHEKIKRVRLIVRSGCGDGQGFASAAEIEFHKANPDAFEPLSLFTDASCTQLRPGISYEQIMSTEHVFFRDIARRMYQGTYPREFRIAEYQAYPNPYNHITTNKMRFPYSTMDNPTGIAVEEGETLVAMVGDTHGHDNLVLRVVDFYQRGTADGMDNRRDYALLPGLNKIKMHTKGLAYVVYLKETIAEADAAEPIKVHIATGTVNGYYNSQKPEHRGRFSQLLSKATHQYFEVLGRKSHLVFPAESFRQNTGARGDELIGVFDQMVEAEQELHGLVKYKRTFKNRMLFSPTYTSGAYMYATNERTAYSPATFNVVTNPDVLRNQIWGPAHEVGHMHQTGPAIMWWGMSECTVNIPSLYVQTTILGKESRLQVEGNGMTRYTMAFTDIIAKESPHGRISDVFRKLVPFWQLELYFGKALGRTPAQQADKGGFYPDVYEYARNNQHPGYGEYYDGLNTIEFAYIASKVSGYNLIDFFTKWGFLRAVDEDMLEYERKRRIKITQAQIDAVKQRIAAIPGIKSLGAVPLHYISDRTVEQFRTKAAIVRGTATRDDRVITLLNWQNVVAIEVEDASGKLVFVGDGTSTTGGGYRPNYTADLAAVGITAWSNTYKAYAISARGERVLVTLP